MILTSFGASFKISPRAVPVGVANAKRMMNLSKYLKSSKDF